MKKLSDTMQRSQDQVWAYGCGKCKCGIANGVEPLAAFSLYESRAVQAHEELILFCECKAGLLYRQLLRKRYNDMSMETRRLILEHISAASTPTIRLETA